jgi:hypothetical protein
MEMETWSQAQNALAEACYQKVHSGDHGQPTQDLKDEGSCETHHECNMYCESLWPKHQERMEYVNSCKTGKCKDLDSSYVLWGWHDCVDKDKSFDDNKQTSCMSECQGENGPKPSTPLRCYADMNTKEVAQYGDSVCWDKLPGQGWFECKIDWSSDVMQYWDWGQGHPPCDWCIVRNFEADAATNRPYVPPPTFGSSRCVPKCEEIIEKKLSHPSEVCDRWDEATMTTRKWECTALYHNREY